MKLNENTKVTLTVGQLKRLIKETDEKSFVIKDDVLIRTILKQYKIEIPKGVKKIAQRGVTGSYCDCCELYVPEGVIEIETNGINNIARLRRLVLPRSLKVTAKNAISWCELLSVIVLKGKSKEKALQWCKDAGLPAGDPFSGYIRIVLDDGNTYVYTGDKLK